MAMREPAADEEQAMPARLQRKCADCETQTAYPQRLQRIDDALKDEEPGATMSMYMQRDGHDAGGPLGSDISASIDALRGNGGSPLASSERNFFEPRFNRDFSDVRIHHGPEAAKIARQVNARAFTIGRDVVFGANEYRPGTEAGRRLMAHELTHTVQQGVGSALRRNVIRREPRAAPYRVVRAPTQSRDGILIFKYAASTEWMLGDYYRGLSRVERARLFYVVKNENKISTYIPAGKRVRIPSLARMRRILGKKSEDPEKKIFDQIILKNGKTLRGKITGQTATTITIALNAGKTERTIAKREVRRVSFSSGEKISPAETEELTTEVERLIAPYVDAIGDFSTLTNLLAPVTSQKTRTLILSHLRYILKNSNDRQFNVELVKNLDRIIPDELGRGGRGGLLQHTRALIEKQGTSPQIAQVAGSNLRLLTRALNGASLIVDIIDSAVKLLSLVNQEGDLQRRFENHREAFRGLSISLQTVYELIKDKTALREVENSERAAAKLVWLLRHPAEPTKESVSRILGIGDRQSQDTIRLALLSARVEVARIQDRQSAIADSLIEASNTMLAISGNILTNARHPLAVAAGAVATIVSIEFGGTSMFALGLRVKGQVMIDPVYDLSLNNAALLLFVQQSLQGRDGSWVIAANETVYTLNYLYQQFMP